MELTQRSLEIGPFEFLGMTINPTIHWYGVIIVIGIILATSLAAWIAKKDEEDTDIVWNGVIWVVILAVIGARLWSVLFPAGTAGAGRSLSLDYLTDLNDGPLAIWSGGLSIFGAILGGLIGILIYARRHKLKRLQWADRVVIALPLGQAIGRWGNYVNQELYGVPTSLPWKIRIDHPVSEYADEQYFHPLFLYESIGTVLICFGLLWLWRNRRQMFQHGDFVLLYLMSYSALRFLLEFIRIEIPTVGGINVSQATTALLFLAAFILFVLRHYNDQFTNKLYPPFGEPPNPKKKKRKKKSRKTRQDESAAAKAG